MNVLAELNAHLASFSEEWPTVRCWSKKHLLTLIRKIIKSQKDKNDDPKFNTANALLEWLELSKIAQLIEETEPVRGGPEETTFYVLELGAAAVADAPDPLELLQAFIPEGIICYFSAIGFHGLSTQQVANHHIAVYGREVTSGTSSGRQVERRTRALVKSTEKNQMGQEAFRYQDVSYYWTKRLPHTLTGIQRQIRGPRTSFRITDLEQTLLDTLHKPVYCGGAAVVHECWAKGWADVDQSKLAEYINKLIGGAKEQRLRRLGALFDLYNYKPEGKLQAMLDECRKARTTKEFRITLLPEIPYPALNERWNVEVP